MSSGFVFVFATKNLQILIGPSLIFFRENISEYKSNIVTKTKYLALYFVTIRQNMWYFSKISVLRPNIFATKNLVDIEINGDLTFCQSNLNEPNHRRHTFEINVILGLRLNQFYM